MRTTAYDWSSPVSAMRTLEKSIGKDNNDMALRICGMHTAAAAE
jgi:hypothetical protein